MFVASTVSQKSTSGAFDFDYDGDNTIAQVNHNSENLGQTTSRSHLSNPEERIRDQGTVVINQRGTSPLGGGVVRSRLYQTGTATNKRVFDIDPMYNSRSAVTEQVHVMEPVAVSSSESFYPSFESRFTGLPLRDPHRAMVIGLD